MTQVQPASNEKLSSQHHTQSQEGSGNGKNQTRATNLPGERAASHPEPNGSSGPRPKASGSSSKPKASGPTPDASGPTPPFPRSFWTANVTELFERGAYYSMASFVVLYLGQLGLGNYWPSTLNGILWSLVYFLPILSGTIADQVGFRRSLLVAFVLLAIGYFLMGFPVWILGAPLATELSSEITAGTQVVYPVVLGIIFIGLGGSVIKPCISGTVQKTSGKRATLGFAIFYMVINVGSLFGRSFGYVARTNFGLSYIFAVGMICSVLAFLVVFMLYRESSTVVTKVDKPRRSIGRILIDMFMVLGNLRFALFLLVSSGFNFLYSQVYNLLLLYLKKFVENDPPVDIYTMANPLTIVLFQLVITKYFGKMKPIRSIIVGTIIIGLSMVINVIPIYASGVRSASLFGLPLASIFIIFTVALIALGELFTMARTYEYIGALAPKGQEGLFLGYANLPMALGSLIGGPVGAWIINDIMCQGAQTMPNGLLKMNPTHVISGWMVLMTIGFASAACIWLYNRWLQRLESQEQARSE